MGNILIANHSAYLKKTQITLSYQLTGFVNPEPD